MLNVRGNIVRGVFRGYQVSRGPHAAVVQLENDVVAISLPLNGRVFTTEAAARTMQAALQRT